MINKISKIETGYAAIVNLLTWIVTYTVCHISDNMLGTLGKVVAILAPLPNAINVFYIVRHTLDYHIVAALAVAIVLEAVLFVTFETMLRQYEMYLEDKVTYKVTLSTSVISSVVILGLVMLLIAMLEGMGVPLIFPLINAVVYISIAINRWTDRRHNEQNINEQLGKLKEELTNTNAKWSNDYDLLNEQLTQTNEQLRETERTLTNTKHQLDEQLTSVNEQSPLTVEQLPNAYRTLMHNLLVTIEQQEIKSQNNFTQITEIPRDKAKTIFDFAKEAGFIYKNGDGKYHVAISH